MSKRLLITADDFGAHNVIDKGIYNCLERNSIDCVDCMVTHHDSTARIQGLVNYRSTNNKQFKIGLHLSMTSGKPLAHNTNQTYLDIVTYGNGYFKWVHEMNIIALNNNHINDLVAEMEAQLQVFVKATGKLPEHVSCHVGFFHLTQQMFDAYMLFIRKHNLPVRNPVLISQEFKPWKGKTLMRRMGTQQAIKVLDDLKLYNPKNIPDAANLFKWLVDKKKHSGKKQTRTRLRFNLFRSKYSLFSTDYFVDHFYGTAHLTALLAIFRNMRAYSYEMVVHPVDYKNNNELSSIPPGISLIEFPQRKREMYTLKNNNIQKIRIQHGIEPFILP